MTTKFKVGDIVQVVKVEDGMLVNIDDSMRKYEGHAYNVIDIIERQGVDDDYVGDYRGELCDHYVLQLIYGYSYPANVRCGRITIWVFTEDMLAMYDDNL